MLRFAPNDKMHVSPAKPETMRDRRNCWLIRPHLVSSTRHHMIARFDGSISRKASTKKCSTQTSGTSLASSTI